jgi:phospholipid transport system substrate-binding protein
MMPARCRLLVSLTLLLATSVAMADDGTPTAVVDRLDASLLGVLQQAEKLGYQGRLERLTPALEQAFDFAFMAEKALGSHWKDLSEPDRARWARAFKDLTLANYAARFERFSGQTFTRLGDEPGTNGTVLVQTKVTDPGDEDVELSYRLRTTEAGWKIIDVYLKGTVSELALRRSEYVSVLERDGFGALLATLDRKIADLTAGKLQRQAR